MASGWPALPLRGEGVARAAPAGLRFRLSVTSHFRSFAPLSGRYRTAMVTPAAHARNEAALCAVLAHLRSSDAFNFADALAAQYEEEHDASLPAPLH